MASVLEVKAEEAFMDDHNSLPVDPLSQAIDLNPTNPDLYADRAQANIKLDNFTGAVADANKAIELNPSLSKAYFLKGSACMKLEEYQTAKTAFETCASLTQEDSRIADLIKECNDRIAEETISIPKQEETVTTDISIDDVQPVSDPPKQVIAPAPKPKYRHEFFQKPDEVVVTIFAKGVPRDSIAVDFGDQILSVNIDVPGKDPYTFQPRLFGKIIPTKCRYEVMSTKVEIRLAKAESIQWTSLEYSKENAVPQWVNVSSVTRSQRPSYPSSKATRDWDKLEAQVKKEEKEEKLDGDAALNKFFREIYQDADDDTRRAMGKSFVRAYEVLCWNLA